jgi:hypothetical protein
MSRVFTTVLVITGAAAGLAAVASEAAAASKSYSSWRVKRFNSVLLNPQPLPPRNRFDGVLLNPQPLPPRSLVR